MFPPTVQESFLVSSLAFIACRFIYLFIFDDGHSDQGEVITHCKYTSFDLHIKNSSQGLKARTPTPWDTERFALSGWRPTLWMTQGSSRLLHSPGSHP